MDYESSKGFLDLEEFLSYFPEPWSKKPTKSEFVNRVMIMYSPPVRMSDAFSLKPVAGRKRVIMKGSDDFRIKNRGAIIDFFYDVLVESRVKYLTEIFHGSFELSDPREMDWDIKDISRGKDTISMQMNDASRRIVKNLFHIELYHLTTVTNSVKSSVSFWDAFTAMFTQLKIEDRFFAPSVLQLCLKPKRGIGGVGEPRYDYRTLYYQLQQYQPKASILNPYTVFWILNELFDGKKLFTPVLSWGSYLIAYMQSRYTDYVGVDVMPGVCKKVDYLQKFFQIIWPKRFGPDRKPVTTICTRSEALLDDPRFMKKYRGYFDSILVCPPYFDMEIYHEGEQSIEEYPSYEEWLEKYWGQTVLLCSMVSEPGAKFGVIANNYNTLKRKHVPLADDLDKITQRYFKLDRVIYLVNRRSPLRSAEKDRTERLFMYTLKTGIKRVPKVRGALPKVRALKRPAKK